MPKNFIAYMYFFIKQVFQIEKNNLCLNVLSTQNPSQRWISVYQCISFCHISFNYLSFTCKFCCIYCFIPTNFQFRILHIFCSHFCSIYFGWLCSENYPGKDHSVLSPISLFSTLVAWFLLSFFNCLCSLLHLLWYLFLLLSVPLSPHWSLSRTYSFFIVSFFVKGEYNPGDFVH